MNVGASVAPLLGGFIAAHSYPALFAVDGATTALYGVILWAALPETRPRESPNGHAMREAFTGAFAAAPAVGAYVMTSAGARWLWIDCLAGGLAVAAGFWMLSSTRLRR